MIEEGPNPAQTLILSWIGGSPFKLTGAKRRRAQTKEARLEATLRAEAKRSRKNAVRLRTWTGVREVAS